MTYVIYTTYHEQTLTNNHTFDDVYLSPETVLCVIFWMRNVK